MAHRIYNGIGTQVRRTFSRSVLNTNRRCLFIFLQKHRKHGLLGGLLFVIYKQVRALKTAAKEGVFQGIPYPATRNLSFTSENSATSGAPARAIKRKWTQRNAGVSLTT